MIVEQRHYASGTTRCVFQSGDHGHLVLALHGFTGRGADWGHLHGAFRSCNLIAPDLPGHGPEKGRAAAPSMTECVESIRELLDAYWGNDPVTAVGYSMGGRVLASAAAAMPARFERIMLIGTHPGLRTSRDREARRRSDRALADRIEKDGVPSFLEYWRTLPIIATQLRIAERTRRAMAEARREHRAAGLAAALRGYGTGAMWPVWDGLGYFEGNLWLTFGDEDSKYRRLAAELATEVRRAHVEAIPDAGHAAHLEAPEAFARSFVRFLVAPAPPG